MYIKVKVVVDSKIEKIEKLEEDSFKIWVRSPAERGLANSRVKEILQEYLNIKNIKLVSGHTSPGKIFSVEG